MLVLSLASFPVALHDRCVTDTELISNKHDEGPRDIKRVGQEAANEPHRGQLQSETHPIVVPTTIANQAKIRITEPTESFPGDLANLKREPTKGTSQVITKELHRHAQHPIAPSRPPPEP